MSIYLSRSYTHMVADFYKGADQNGPYYLVRYLFADWADSDTIVNEMMGLVYRVGGATVRGTPHQHPLSPNLYCVRANCLGNGKPVLNAYGFPYYDNGFVIEAEYRASVPNGVIQLADDPSGNQQIDPATPILWCTQELDYDTEVVTFGANTLQWLSDGKRARAPYQQQISLTTMQLTFHRVPYIPTPLIRAKKGRTNNATFLNVPQGRLLFKGARTTREASTDGTVVQKVTEVFIEREEDWNKELRKPNVWDELVDDVGNSRYQQTDLSPLIYL